MKYKVRTTNQFEKAVRLCAKRNYPMDLLQTVISKLADEGVLPQEYKPHKLKGYAGNRTWECHIQADWLLIWEQYDEELVLMMLNTGTHSDLF